MVHAHLSCLSIIASVSVETARFSPLERLLFFPMVAVSMLSLTADGFPFHSVSRQCSCRGSIVSGLENSIPYLQCKTFLARVFDFRQPGGTFFCWLSGSYKNQPLLKTKTFRDVFCEEV